MLSLAVLLINLLLFVIMNKTKGVGLYKKTCPGICGDTISNIILCHGMETHNRDVL